VRPCFKQYDPEGEINIVKGLVAIASLLAPLIIAPTPAWPDPHYPTRMITIESYDRWAPVVAKANITSE
jgi:hypothetical protein